MANPHEHSNNMNILSDSHRHSFQNTSIRAAGNDMHNHSHAPIYNIHIYAQWQGYTNTQDVPRVGGSSGQYPEASASSAQRTTFPPEDPGNFIPPSSVDDTEATPRPASFRPQAASNHDREPLGSSALSGGANDYDSPQYNKPSLRVDIPQSTENAGSQVSDLLQRNVSQLSTASYRNHQWGNDPPEEGGTDPQPRRSHVPDRADISPEVTAPRQQHRRQKQIFGLPDLTGQVRPRTGQPVIIGSQNEIYIGTWSAKGKVQVALRLSKTLSDSDDSYNRFRREVTLWHAFDHPNLLPLYGIASIDNHLFAVSPWMFNGTAIEFIKKHPDVDVPTILSDITEGVAYLHSKDIIHGDIRGAHILISIDGSARLSDFRFSRSMENVGQDLPRSPLNPRWFSPEISGCEKQPVWSKQSDIWSLGMTFLELLTGERPFRELEHDQEILHAHHKGILPTRPPNIGEDMWDLLSKRCWKRTLKSRAGIEEVQKALASIRQGPRAKRRIMSFISLGSKKSSQSSSSSRPNTASSHLSRNSSLSFGTWRAVETPLSSYCPSLGQFVESTHDDPIHLSRQPKLHSPGEPLEFSSGPARGTPVLQASTSTAAGVSKREGMPLDRGHENAAVSPRMRNVVTDHLGVVTAGTLEGLVDRLVEHTYLTKDGEFREVMITASIDITTPKDFCAKLWELFYAAEKDRNRSPEKRITTQMNVFEVMRYWLTHPHLPTDAELLWEMQIFCKAAREMKSSPTMVNKAQDLLHLIEIRPKQDTGSRNMPPSRKMLDAKNITPHGLALAMTLLEGDKFKQITPCDYLAYLCERPEYTSVEAADTVNRKIITWVKKCLLNNEALNPRVTLMKFFIDTAEECRKLRNFQSLVAIALALSSPEIQNLRLTKRRVKDSAGSQLEDLVRLCSADRNYYQYRQALERATDPTYRNYCIPWINAHVEELRSVLYFHKKIIEFDGQPLINVKRYTEFMSRVKVLFPLPPPDLERYRHRGELAYLEAQLARVTTGEAADNELRAKSQSLKASEDRIDTLRLTERGNLGFRTPQQLQRRVTG